MPGRRSIPNPFGDQDLILVETAIEHALIQLDSVIEILGLRTDLTWCAAVRSAVLDAIATLEGSMGSTSDEHV